MPDAAAPAHPDITEYCTTGGAKNKGFMENLIFSVESYTMHSMDFFPARVYNKHMGFPLPYACGREKDGCSADRWEG